MDERHLEARLLELAFTTEAPITATALAFFAPCSLQEASAILDRLAAAGTLRIESDDEGNIYYEMPNRARVAGPTAQALAKRPPSTAIGRPIIPGSVADGAIRRPVASDAPLVNPVMTIGAPAPAAPLVVLPRPGQPVSAAEVAAAVDPGSMVECPYCAEPIRAAAKKCKHCGEMLDPTLRQAPQPVQVNVQNVNTLAPAHPRAVVVHDSRHTSPGIAALLSGFWPGAGQIYTGRVGQGLLWMLGTAIAYIPFILPGLILHVVCMFNAANVARRDNEARARALLGAAEQPQLMP
jgi:TM2 domain-containing membrane protein YozV